MVLLSMMLHSSPRVLAGSENFNYRILPAWSPESASTYSFRSYMTVISLWIMLTDLQPHQQSAAIVMRLGGAARELARMMSPQGMASGGMRDGVVVGLVTLLLGALRARFASVEKESRRPGETINAFLATYETVRQRAAVQGQFFMSSESCSLQMLRACGIQSQHLLVLLQPAAFLRKTSANRPLVPADTHSTSEIWTDRRRCTRQHCSCVAWPHAPGASRCLFGPRRRIEGELEMEDRGQLKRARTRILQGASGSIRVAAENEKTKDKKASVRQQEPSGSRGRTITANIGGTIGASGSRDPMKRVRIAEGRIKERG
jgi:hypothetical protein